jgi:hypothetical protein
MASFYADAEDGTHVDNPTTEAIAALIDTLNPDDNTFLTIGPDDDDPTWYASVTLLDNGTYEVEHNDPGNDLHHISNATTPQKIAQELTTWLASQTSTN